MHLHREVVTRADRRALRRPLWFDVVTGAILGVALSGPLLTLWLALTF